MHIAALCSNVDDGHTWIGGVCPEKLVTMGRSIKVTCITPDWQKSSWIQFCRKSPILSHKRPPIQSCSDVGSLDGHLRSCWQGGVRPGSAGSSCRGGSADTPQVPGSPSMGGGRKLLGNKSGDYYNIILRHMVTIVETGHETNTNPSFIHHRCPS